MDKAQKPGNQTEDTPAGDIPFGVSEMNSGAIDKPATERKLEEVENKMSSFERSTLRLAIANLVAVAATCIFIALQWQEMKSGGKDTANLAEAAKKQADVLTKAQRAFLSIDTIDSLQGRTENRVIDWRFIFGWKNNGNTPTRSMEFHRSYEVRFNELPSGFTFPDYWSTPPPHRRSFMVAPPQSRVGMIPIVVSIIAINEVINGLRGGHRTHLYVWGWARYRDVFDKTPWHLTEFCSELTDFLGNPLAVAGQGNTVTPVFTQCPAHNCSDEDCPDYKQKITELEN